MKNIVFWLSNVSSSLLSILCLNVSTFTCLLICQPATLPVIRLCPSYCLLSPNCICHCVGSPPLDFTCCSASVCFHEKVLLMMTHGEVLLFQCVSAVQPLTVPVSVPIHYPPQFICPISVEISSLLYFQATFASLLKIPTHVLAHFNLFTTNDIALLFSNILLANVLTW